MTRSDLKSLVKECLLEILNDGLGVQTDKNRKFEQPTHSPIFQENKKIQSTQNTRRPTRYLQEAVKREAGGDKVMESILADTARTTLATQIAHGDSTTPAPGTSRKGVVQQEQISGTPEQIFGEDVASKWASLAFMDSSTKK